MKLLLLILLFPISIFASWIFIHLLALAGPFLVIACLSWNVRKYLQRKKNKNNVKVKLSKLSVSSLRVFGFLVISFLPLVLVIVEKNAIGTFMNNKASVSLVGLVEETSEVEVESEFAVPIEIRNVRKAINAVRVELQYNPAVFQVTDISTEGSFASVFVEREIDNQNGHALISGGLPYPGYSGGNPLFSTFYFKALQPGNTIIEVLPTSLVFENDGKGTNVPVMFRSVKLGIISEREKQERVRITSKKELLEDQELSSLSNEVVSIVPGRLYYPGNNYVLHNKSFNDFLGIIYKADNLITDVWKNLLMSVK